MGGAGGRTLLLLFNPGNSHLQGSLQPQGLHVRACMYDNLVVGWLTLWAVACRVVEAGDGVFKVGLRLMETDGDWKRQDPVTCLSVDGLLMVDALCAALTLRSTPAFPL